MSELTPSENEWAIMEIIWQRGGTMTAAEIIEALRDILSISPKTIRVMIGRLVGKGVLGYEVDPEDARVYHYRALRTREECRSMKSERFVKNYFGGDASLAAASFIKSAGITDEQLKELRRMLDEM